MVTFDRREDWEDICGVSDHVLIGRYMRGPDCCRWIHLEAVLPDSMRRRRLPGGSLDDGGVVPGVHVGGRAGVAASESELDRRGVADRGGDGGGVLHHDVVRVGDGGEAPRRVVRSCQA